ncbi:MAG: BrnA antitoxin family protein [Magnetococcales bacterium]|nr:BrnA antitoxin family protein [Magnetococcales bacterium]
MENRKPLTDEAGEVRELMAEDLRNFRQIDSLSPSLARKLGVRGAQKAPTKERITIRLSREVVEAFRATGNGWQSRVDDVLKGWVTTHSA